MKTKYPLTVRPQPADETSLRQFHRDLVSETEHRPRSNREKRRHAALGQKLIKATVAILAIEKANETH